MADDRERRVQPSDEYEAGMVGEGAVLHRDKVVGRTLALVMLLGTIFFGIASIALLAGWQTQMSILTKVLTFALTPLFPFVLLTRCVVRTVVTPQEVAIHWGLWGPRIKIAAITRCEVIPKERIREEQKRGGVELFAPDVTRECVMFEWTDDKGKARRVLLSSDDPRALVAAVGQAKRVTVGDARLGVGASSGSSDAEAGLEEAALKAEVEVEAAAEAELAKESRKREGD